MTSHARVKLLELGNQHSLMLHHLLATVHRPTVQHHLQRLGNRSTNSPTAVGLSFGWPQEEIKQKPWKHSQKQSRNKSNQETFMHSSSAKHISTALLQNRVQSRWQAPTFHAQKKSTPKIIQLRSQPHHFEAGSSTYTKCGSVCESLLMWLKCSDLQVGRTGGECLTATMSKGCMAMVTATPDLRMTQR